jgi:hypothetical protein
MLCFSSLEVSIFVFIFFPTNSYFAPFNNHSDVIGFFHYFQSHPEDLWLMKSNLPWKCKTTSVIWIFKSDWLIRLEAIYQPRLSSITKISSRRISQSDWNIQIKLNYSDIMF